MGETTHEEGFEHQNLDTNETPSGNENGTEGNEETSSLAEQPEEQVEPEQQESDDQHAEVIAEDSSAEESPEGQPEKAEVAEPVLQADPSSAATSDNEEDADDGDDGKDVEGEDEEEEGDDGLEEANIAELDKTELIAFIEEVIRANRPLKLTAKVREARELFDAFITAERNAAKAAYLESGGEELDFNYQLQDKDRTWRSLCKIFFQKRKERIAAREKEMEDNLKGKRAILERIKELTDNAADPNAFNQLKELQAEWREIGMVPQADIDSLMKSYRFLNDQFFAERSLVKELLELDRKKNLDAKQEIVKSILDITQLEDLSAMMKALRKQQAAWNDIGQIPRENLDEVMEAYRASVAAVLEKKDALAEVLDAERGNNLVQKLAVLEDIKELLDDEKNGSLTWKKRNQKLGAHIEQWKKIGSVPQAERENMRKTFRDLVKEFNSRKNAFFKDLKKEQSENLRLKKEACEKVESLLEVDNLRSHREAVIQIQKDWKSIGPVQGKHSDEVWKRFRTACDAFFNKLKEGDSERNKEQQENLKKKEALCEKLEALVEGGDFEDGAIKEIEEEFASVGFVPFKAKDAINQRFRKAARRALRHNVNLDDVEPALHDFKIKIEELLRSDDGDNRLEQELNRLKRDLSKKDDEINTFETNIGFFANSKGAESLKKEVEAKIEKAKEDSAHIKKKIGLLRKSMNLVR